MRILTLLASLMIVTVFSLLVVTTVGAVDVVDPSLCDGGNDPSICQIDNSQSETENVLVGPNGLITRIAKVLVWVSGTLAVILIIIAGLMFVFSQGNAESAGRARSTVIYALIGMVIAIVGQAIVSFVLSEL